MAIIVGKVFHKNTGVSKAEQKTGWEFIVKKFFNENLRFVVATLVLGCVILLCRFFAASMVEPYEPPEKVVTIPGPISNLNSGGPLVIHDALYDLECGNNGEVISAIFYVELLGGVPPYEVDFDPGDLIIPDVHDSFVIFTLKGGKSLTVRAKSNTVDGEPMNSKDVYAPSHHLSCETQTFIDTPTLTLTPTPISTSISTPTKSATLGSTTTKDNNTLLTTPPPTTPLPTTPVPTTPVPTTPVPTTLVPTTLVPTTPVPTTPVPTTPVPTTLVPTTPVPTTPVPTTPVPTTPVPTTLVPTTPVPTTPVPTTPVPTTPVPTTPVPTTPVPTTPVPTTSVPTTPHPNKSECEDGIDNDNDGKIDLEDPQCRSSNDNHEDK